MKILRLFRFITLINILPAALLTPKAPAQSVFDQQADITLENSVIMIRAVSQEFDYITPWKQSSMGQGVGSGFVIAGNRILTNAHNVSNCKYVELKKQNNSKRYPAKVEFIAHDCDLATLLPADTSFFQNTQPLEFGPIPQVNSTVQTYGFSIGGEQVSVTEGVVSRVEIDSYSHTQADAHLVVQTDAAINPGNSGGPVLQNGLVVGVAFQGLRSADNIGYMIPTTVIEHFLTDIEDGQYHGFGSVGFSFYTGLHNDAYRKYLKVPADQQGVITLKTTLNSSVENIIQRHDVVTKVDDYDIDNDGNVRIHGLKLHMSEVIEQKQIGDNVEITYYRNGQPDTVTAQVALNRPPLTFAREFDEQPRYYVYAGFVFVPLSRNYLETWGRNWITDLPFTLRYLFLDADWLNEDPDRKEYIVLSTILPDEINSYCQGFKNGVIEEVNGHKINQLKDLQKAINSADSEFLTFKFISSDTKMILNRSKANQRHPLILKKYEVPAEANLNN